MDIQKLYPISYVFDQIGLAGMVIHRGVGQLPKRRPWRAIIKLTQKDWEELKWQAWYESIKQGWADPGSMTPPSYFIMHGIRYEAMTDDEEAGVETSATDTPGT